MQPRLVFTANYIYAFAFGAAFILFPAWSSSLIGFQVAGDAPLIARVLGIFVLATGLLTFFARHAAESAAREAIIRTLFILYSLLIVYKIALHTVFGIPFNPVFGVIYVLHLAFVLAYGQILLSARRAAVSGALAG